MLQSNYKQIIDTNTGMIVEADVYEDNKHCKKIEGNIHLGKSSFQYHFTTHPTFGWIECDIINTKLSKCFKIRAPSLAECLNYIRTKTSTCYYLMIQFLLKTLTSLVST